MVRRFPAVGLTLLVLISWALLSCGQNDQTFAPPLLLDSAGLQAQVSLHPQALQVGEPRQAYFPATTRFHGHMVALSASSMLTLRLAADRPVGVALYGPRRSDGLFGAAREWGRATSGRPAVLDDLQLAESGDYLVLAADLGGSGGSYHLRLDSAAEFQAPSCPALVCGRYCATGLARDSDGCPLCECATGCESDADCPVDFSCQVGVCCKAQNLCGCQNQPYDPVCGSDGITYANLCELECVGWAVDHPGPCPWADCNADDDCSPGMRCEPGGCVPACDCWQAGDDPVCGFDGVTYFNDCERACAGVDLDHRGPCELCQPELCGDWHDNDCDGFIDEDCAGSCGGDADCPVDYVCLGGVCAAEQACTEDGGCPVGQVCENGRCYTANGCTVEICHDGVDNDCDNQVDEGCSACRTHDECPPDRVCLAGVCSPACDTDADIDGYLAIHCGGDDCDDDELSIHPDADEICDGIDNNCDGQMDEGCTATCSADSDCPNQVCTDGICWRECTETADCNGREVCHDGVCAVPCQLDPQCPQGLSCHFTQRVCIP